MSYDLPFLKSSRGPSRNARGFFKPVHLELSSEDRGYYNPGPIEFTFENAQALRSEIYRTTSGKSERFRDRTILLQEPLRSVLRRFYIALDAYRESKEPVMTDDIIIDLALQGPIGAQTLKRIKTKSFLNYSLLVPLEKPEWWDEVRSYNIHDIGSIFNYSYLIHWQEPDPEDYLLGHTPVHIKPEVLLDFKNKLFDILPERDSFLKVEDFEILSKLSSSSSYLDQTNMSVPNWRIKSQFLSFAREHRPYKRSIIQVGPANTRDAHTVPPDILNSINWLDKQVHRIIQEIPGNAMIDDVEDSYKTLYSFRRKYPNFLCRDIKKEGITKPRELLQAAQEVLTEKYPDLPWWRMGIYNKYSLIIDGVGKQEFERGHGLGLANSLTTLVQLAVFRMILDRMDLAMMNSSDMDCLVYNDDFVAGFEDEDVLFEYWDYEGEVFDDLSLLRHPTKSFFGNDFVFLEVYHPYLNDKESFVRREVLMSLACANIAHAKGYFSSIESSVNRFFIDAYKEEIITYWGYEFLPDEADLPFSFGGWINQRKNNVDFSFVGLKSNAFLSALYLASKVKKVIIRSKKEKIGWKTPVETLLNIDLQSDPFRDKIGALSRGAASKALTRQSNYPIQSFLAWQAIKRKRLKIFRRSTEIHSISEVFYRYQLDNPDVDLIPEDETITRVQLKYMDSERVAWDSWFKSPRPVYDYLKYTYEKDILGPNEAPGNPLPLMIPSCSKTWSSKRDLFEDFGITSLRFTSSDSEENFEKKMWDLPEAAYRSYLNPQQVADELAERGISRMPIPLTICEKTFSIIAIRDAFTSNFRGEQYPFYTDKDLALRRLGKLCIGDSDLQELLLEELMRFETRNEVVLENPPPEPENPVQDEDKLSDFDLFWTNVNESTIERLPPHLLKIARWYTTSWNTLNVGLNIEAPRFAITDVDDIIIATNMSIKLKRLPFGFVLSYEVTAHLDPGSDDDDQVWMPEDW